MASSKNYTEKLASEIFTKENGVTIRVESNFHDITKSYVTFSIPLYKSVDKFPYNPVFPLPIIVNNRSYDRTYPGCTNLAECEFKIHNQRTPQATVEVRLAGSFDDYLLDFTYTREEGLEERYPLFPLEGIKLDDTEDPPEGFAITTNNVTETVQGDKVVLSVHLRCPIQYLADDRGGDFIEKRNEALLNALKKFEVDNNSRIAVFSSELDSKDGSLPWSITSGLVLIKSVGAFPMPILKRGDGSTLYPIKSTMNSWTFNMDDGAPVKWCNPVIAKFVQFNESLDITMGETIATA